MIVDLRLWLDGVNVDELNDIDDIITGIEANINSVHPVKYEITYVGD